MPVPCGAARFRSIRVRTRPGDRTRGVLLAGTAGDPGRARPRAASAPTSARATAPPRAGASGSCGCGGGPIASRGRAPCCRCAASRPTWPGARIPPTVATTARSGARPLNQATGCGGTTSSTTSSSRSTTTPGRGSPAAAARCSSMWRGPTGRRPPAAWRCGRTTSGGCCAGLGPKTRIEIQS